MEMNKVVTGICSLVPGGCGHRSTRHPGSPALAQAISWVYYFYICAPFPRILQETAGLCGISIRYESRSFLMKKPDTLWLSSLAEAPRPSPSAPRPFLTASAPGSGSAASFCPPSPPSETQPSGHPVSPAHGARSALPP